MARTLLGGGPDFTVPPFGPQPLASFPAYLVLGVLAGVVGVLHNRMLLATLGLFDRARAWPAGALGLVVGGVVGVVAWYAPEVVGGGDTLAQRILTTGAPLVLLPWLLLVRLALGVVSYAVGAPGGLFAPLLALGALLGLPVGLVTAHLLPGAAPEPTAFAVVGMAALFTAVVRAPLTGMTLLTEMTASAPLVLPMVAASFTAYAVATMLGDEPIYDALGTRERRDEAR